MHLPAVTATTRTVTAPNAKLSQLCETAESAGGGLTTFAAVARELRISAGRVTQLFGHAEDTKAKNIDAKTLERLAAAFTADGVRCEPEWLVLELNDFATSLANANPAATSARRSTTTDASAADWQFNETTVLPDLVELRLHPPRVANEVPGSYYVDATLLFGTACADYVPEDGSDPRTIAIALRKALLAIGSDSYRPLKGSMLGERGETSVNYKRVAGGVEVSGPAIDGVLEGDPIGEQHLAVIAGTNAGNDAFTVTVATNWGSFVVSDADAPAARAGSNAPSSNKAAILNALIYKDVGKDQLGRPLLARATMRRQPEANSEAQ